MPKRLEFSAPACGFLVEDVPGGVARYGPLRGEDLRRAEAQLAAEREVNAVRAAIVEQAQAEPVQAAQPSGRPLLNLGLPVQFAARVRGAIDHPEY
jgi:hypothetical protein